MKYTLIALSTLLATVLNAKTLVMYSARTEPLILPLVEEYKKETGIEVRYITGDAGPLLQRILAEKDKTSADILMTVDAGNLWHAKESGVFSPVSSDVLQKKIPAHLRDPDNQWYALSVRARTIFFNPEKVKKEELSSYEDLASEKWKNRLCLRTSKKVYNQSLVAMMLEHQGEKKTKEVVSSWVKNLAQPVFSNDTKLLEAISSGVCSVGIANTYYYGRMIKDAPQKNLDIFWANQSSTGTHVNISGAGVVKYSKNKQEAIRFLEWLVSPKAQEIIADLNMEYPVSEGINFSKVVKKWGSFKKDTTNLNVAGKNQALAVRLMEDANYK